MCVFLVGCASPAFQSRIDKVMVVDATRFGPVLPVIASGQSSNSGARVVVHRGLSDRTLAARYPNPSVDGVATYAVSSPVALREVEQALSGSLTQAQRGTLEQLRDDLALFEYKRRKAISAQSGLGSFQYRRMQRMIHQ